MLEVISPFVERAGLRNAMKILHQKYPETPDREEMTTNDNDTDSEKRKNMSGSGDNSAAAPETTLAPLNVKETVSRPGILGGRNRQLSTDTIKVILWGPSFSLSQLRFD